MTIELTVKTCHIGGTIWLILIGALIFPLILNVSNIVNTIPNTDVESNATCYWDFYDHEHKICKWDVAGTPYFYLLGNIGLLGFTIFVGLYWLNDHYHWIRLNLRSCW